MRKYEYKKYEYKGQLLTITELSKLVGIASATLRNRIKRWKWSVHKAATTPVVSHGRFSRKKILLFCDPYN